MSTKSMKQKILCSNLSRFEKDVLIATLSIPKGKTASYSDIAVMIKRPKAYRAVGNALNKNPFAPNVPCHRVIHKNRDVGGYAMGTTRKIGMLKSEGITF